MSADPRRRDGRRRDGGEATGGAPISRRSWLLGAAGAVGVGLLGGARTTETPGGRRPLWRTAERRGIAFGTAFSTRLLEDAAYAQLVDRESAVLLAEDDLLWYRLKPTPDAALDFRYGDRLVDLAERQRQLLVGAHLVWDDGFGEGWPAGHLFELDRADAEELLYGTVEAVVSRYRGRLAGWIVVNEAVDANEEDGLRRDYPWYATIGESFLERSFHLAREADPDATLILNEFGHETDDEEGDAAADKRAKTLLVLDRLRSADVPVDALGVQAHLFAADFAARFDGAAFRRFLSEVADLGLEILITELDVLDDGLPADPVVRDRAVAEACRRFLDVTLEEPAVRSVMTFGLSDRHTWLEEDYPREDGTPRRPLPFDEALRPKAAVEALTASLDDADRRPPLWRSPRGRRRTTA